MFSFFKKKIIVPHVRLSGVIGSVGRFRQGIDFSGQQEIIKKAFSFKKAKAIAISVNSPGGSPVQSHLIHDYIRQLAKKNKKKVIVFAEDVAASGGYLIACAGDEIYGNSSSIVGSIGVLSAAFGFHAAIKKIGNSSITFAQEIYRDGSDELINEAEIIWVNTNQDEMKPASIPEDLKNKFGKYILN